VQQIKVQQGAGAVAIALTLSNLTITGMNNVTVLGQRYFIKKYLLLING
jgi:hypothetical protein